MLFLRIIAALVPMMIVAVIPLLFLIFAADGYFYVTYDDGGTHFSYHQP